MARSTGIPQLLRGYESWVDIPSQSSSTLQSPESPVNSEIVTTGLRVQHASNTQRRRRITTKSSINAEARGTSSQEEYEESESDEDHVLTSSNEHVAALSCGELDSESEREEIEKNPFAQRPDTWAHNPQQNPLLQEPSDQSPDGSGGQTSPNSTSVQSSYAVRNLFHQNLGNRPTDQDAALRASLTTLLSIGAAAARGLPKREITASRDILTERSHARNNPIGLRLISESELMGPSVSHLSTRAGTRAISRNSIDANFSDKGKQKAISGTKTRAIKKSQSEPQESVPSPTFLTWALSAGVLVLISVVGFGAGYVIGRELGKQEIMAGMNSSALNNGSNCGKEVMRNSSVGLKHFKWRMSGSPRIATT